MKKIIAISALLTSLLAIAGPKADIQTANKLFAENKRDQAIKVLKDSKNVKGEEAEYEMINYVLAKEYSKSPEEAIEYLKKAVENPKSDSRAAIQANIDLIKIAKTNKEKIKYLEMLNKREGNFEALSNLAALYKVENETSKFNYIVKSIENTKNQDIIDNFNLLLGKYLLDLNKESDGLSYLNKAENSKFVNVKSKVYLAYAEYYVAKKDVKNATKYLNAASVDKRNYHLISYRFLNHLGDVKTAYSYAEKAHKDSPANIEYLKHVFVVSIVAKDSKGEERYASLLKKIGAKNITLANLLRSSAIYLNRIYRNEIYGSAEKYAKLALKDKSKGADDLLKELEAIKKQAK